MTDAGLRFGFGENWEKYIKERFSEERVQISKEHMLDFLKMQDLIGKTFLDIGCGSGLHSLAALKAGARRVVSFDYDPRSVSTAKLLHTYAGKPENWVVKQGSILDMQYIAGLEPVDIVYSWGVLHHTGSMWQALENTKKLMKEESVLYIALYGDDLYFGMPKSYWADVKKRYNLAGRFQKKRIELWYFWEFYLNKNWLYFPRFLKQAKEYRKKIRGMDIYRDAVDWLGGWPFEYASVSEVKDFASSRMGLELINLATEQACVEYLFSFPRS